MIISRTQHNLPAVRAHSHSMGLGKWEGMMDFNFMLCTVHTTPGPV